MIGIYKITSPSGKVYIGQSINIEKRFKDYKYLCNCKGQIKLYRSFTKHGVGNHIFEIIENCIESELNNRERYWQDFYNCMYVGLNCKLTTTNDKSGRLSIETRYKIGGRKNTADHFRKLILDLQTGIFYLGVKEAANVYYLNTGTLSQRLNGKLINNTNLIYV